MSEKFYTEEDLATAKREAREEMADLLKKNASGFIYQNTFEYKSGFKQSSGTKYEVVLTEAIDSLLTQFNKE